MVMFLMLCLASILFISTPLLYGSRATIHSLLPYGAILAGFDQLYISTSGVPKAAAICPGPVSLLTTSFASLSKATSSLREVWPAKFIMGTSVKLLIASIILPSDSVPTAIIGRLKRGEILSARAANRPPGQHLPLCVA